MTVQELIEKLSQFDGNTKVVLSPVISQTEVTSVESDYECSPYDQDFDEPIVVIG